MNKKAKIIIAALIFIFLGLIIYAFAAPSDEESLDNRVQQVEKDKNTTSEDTEKESEEESEEKEETKTNVVVTNDTKKVDEKYNEALALVEKVEKSLTKEDLEAAKNAVGNVSETDVKALEERLNKVASDLDAESLVEALAALVEEADSSKDIKDANTYNTDNEVADKVDQVNNADLKKALEDKLADLLVILSDTTAPEVNIANGTITNAEEVKVVVTDETNLKTVNDGTELTITDNKVEVTYTEEGTVTIVATDAAFNETKVTLTIDRTAPTVDVTYSETDPTNADWVAVRIIANEEIQSVDGYTLSTGNKILSKLIYNNNEEPVKVVVKDLAGNETEVEYQVTNIDRTAPEVISQVQKLNKNKNRIELTTEFSEPVITMGGNNKNVTTTKVTTYYYRTKTITVGFKDLAGNENSYTINIDMTAPVVNVSYSTTDLTNQDVIVRLTANEEIQSVDGYTLSTGNTILSKTITENTGDVEVVVKDLVGNETVVTYNVSNIDKVKPAVTVSYSETNPTNADWVAVRIIANEEIQSVDGYTLSTGNKILSKLIYNNNEEPVKVVVKDLAGNETEVEYQVTNIDRVAPVITPVGTMGRSAYELRVESGTEVSLNDVLATVTDNVDATTQIEPYKADLLIGTAQENIYNYDFSNGFNTRYKSGRYNIYYKYTDQAGNEATATLLLIMNDTTAPVITVPGEVNRLGDYQMIVERTSVVTLDQIKATVTDNVDETTQILPSRADLLIGTAEENTYNYDITQGINTDKTGRYNLTYTYTDKAGHTTTAGLMLVIVDTTAPVVTASYETVNQSMSFGPNGLVVTGTPTTTFTSNEEVRIKEIVLNGVGTNKPCTVNGDNITNYNTFSKEIIMTVPELYNNPETWDYSSKIVFEDRAGNTTTITEVQDLSSMIPVIVPVTVTQP